MARSLVVASVAALSLAAGGEARPLTTAIVDDSSFGANSGAAFNRARLTGANAVRLTLYWYVVARRRPADAANPQDRAYDWASIDRVVRLARRARLEPILTIAMAPEYASGAGSGPKGTVRPDPAEYGKFARAAARRYSGSMGLPRVRYWQAWNEPNISLYLNPQFVGNRPFSPGHYRRMLNAFYAGVKSVHADNFVVAGGTAPFRDITGEVMKVNARWGPLTFMRELLCLTKSLARKCRARVRFDAWAHHPYTSGGPTHHALLPDDVSLGDLPEMKDVLDAGIRAGNVPRRVQFWVTEFSWDSSPPDPRGVPVALEARWVAEALYRMWRTGITLVTWFQLRDDPMTQSFFQSSLFFRGASFETDHPKPALQAFKFPLVAIPQRSGVLVWGRTPWGKRGRVLIEQSFNGGWRELGVVSTDTNGIFQRTFRAPRTGSVRARVLGRQERAWPFSLGRVADRFFNPFGQDTILEKPRKRGM